jgi:hypothetical protein
MQEQELLRTEQRLDPATRPSRLSLWLHIAVVVLIVLAFISGAVIWYCDFVTPESEEPPFNVHPWRILHGSLNPFLCTIFGYLLCHHIRIGWQLRANWISGFFMEAVFAALILTSIGLYYAPESWHETLVNTHRIIGLLLPVTLLLHWVRSQTWIRKVQARV